MNRPSLILKSMALCFVIAATTVACKKEEPPSKTNQDCMSAYGYAYYSAGGACGYSAALACTSTNSHWMWGGWYGYSVQFIRNGSATSGTGKMKHNWTGAPVSNFLWHLNELDPAMIMCHDYDTVYAASEHILQMSDIQPNLPNNPSAVDMNCTTGNGTGWDQMALVGGAL
jgi:hypothetical protein